MLPWQNDNCPGSQSDSQLHHRLLEICFNIEHREVRGTRGVHRHNKIAGHGKLEFNSGLV